MAYLPSYLQRMYIYAIDETAEVEIQMSTNLLY